MPGEGYDLSVQIFEGLIGNRFVIAKHCYSSQMVETGLIFGSGTENILHELLSEPFKGAVGCFDRCCVLCVGGNQVIT